MGVDLSRLNCAYEWKLVGPSSQWRVEVKDRHVKDEPGIMPAAARLKPLPHSVGWIEPVSSTVHCLLAFWFHARSGLHFFDIGAGCTEKPGARDGVIP